MALPLTVKTETVLATQLRCHQSRITDRGIGDPQREADLHILTEHQEAQKEDGMTTMQTGLATDEGSRSITKITVPPITNVVPESLMKTLTEALLHRQVFHTMITTDMSRGDLELGAARPTGQIGEMSTIVTGSIGEFPNATTTPERGGTDIPLVIIMKI